jgi:hypothetical protein
MAWWVSYILLKLLWDLGWEHKVVRSSRNGVDVRENLVSFQKTGSRDVQISFGLHSCGFAVLLATAPSSGLVSSGLSSTLGTPFPLTL